MRARFIILAATIVLATPAMAQQSADSASTAGSGTSASAGNESSTVTHLESPKLATHAGADLAPLAKLNIGPNPNAPSYRDARNRLVTPPAWIRVPTDSELMKFWPAPAGAAGGHVKLRCRVTLAFKVDACAVLTESPEGLGLGAAALKLSSVFVMQPEMINGVPDGDGIVTIPVSFARQIAPAAFVPPNTPTYRDPQNRLITRPHWLKTPTENELAQFWPAHASGGQVRIRCAVTTRTTLDNCKVISEYPPGLGLGGAAMLASSLFRMQPQLIDGVPVEGATVTIPINFVGNGFSPPSAPSLQVTNSMAWSAAPTAAELAAAFPAQAVGRTESGRVLLRCGFTDGGRLTRCDAVSVQPEGMGFERAARELSKSFRVFDDPDYVKKTHGLQVDVAFDFHDPHKPLPPVEMHDPVWLQTASPGMAGRLFPEEALKVGLKTGRAIVACQAAHDGSLSGCTVVQEEPPSLGFGEAALAIAGVMKMNPWTTQGSPVDGALIRLPIRVNYSDTTEVAPAAKVGSAQPPG